MKEMKPTDEGDFNRAGQRSAAICQSVLPTPLGGNAGDGAVINICGVRAGFPFDHITEREAG
ncbi:MAG: hypothetical protein QOJ76_2062, partial [Acidobacteriota bacterium]|nr:hypothetical protein [Acidobacteriota bacterium]